MADQLIKLTDPLGNETKFTYSPLGHIQSITNANDGQTTYNYYPGGKVKSVSMPSGESESYEYDKSGNVVAVTDALDARSEIKYDQLGRVVETKNPLGHSNKLSYDSLGNITSVTDEKGNITRYRYSLLGDVIEVVDAKGHSTKYGYDASRQLIKLEQFRMIDDPFATYAGAKRKEMQITTYERNKKGEVMAVNSPLGKVVKFGYDSVGNVTSKLDEDGFETLYEYNLASKLTKVSYADGKTVEFGYNALKQLTVMEDWLGITRIELDPLGRATKVTDAQGDEVAYRWNPLGQREKLIYPDGSVVGYEYDSSGRIKKVKSQEGVTNYSYDMMGRLRERVLPDSTTTKYEVNPLGRLTGLVHSRDGDNVAIEAANILAARENPIHVDTLITIGTPVRNDKQLTTNVGQHINVFNTGDVVQINGGRIWRLGAAGRTFESALNIEVASSSTLWGLLDRPLDSHSFMHQNADVWQNYIVPNLQNSPPSLNFLASIIMMAVAATKIGLSFLSRMKDCG